MSESHETLGGYGIKDALRDARREQETLIREKELIEASVAAGSLDANSGAARLADIGEELFGLAVEIGVLRAALGEVKKTTMH